MVYDNDDVRLTAAHLGARVPDSSRRREIHLCKCARHRVPNRIGEGLKTHERVAVHSPATWTETDFSPIILPIRKTDYIKYAYDDASLSAFYCRRGSTLEVLLPSELRLHGSKYILT